MELVTGYAGKAHVSSADQGRYNAGVVGPGRYVLKTGNQMAATIESANSVRIAEGDACMDGRHITIERGSSDLVTIQDGVVGTYRKDIIAIKYTKADTGVESAELFAIKGTEASTESGASLPEYEAGNILEGDVEAIMPLYVVKITGASITEVEECFELLKPISEHAEMIYPVGAIYMSMNNVSPESFIGGKWERISGRFLFAADNSHVAGSTGGSETVTLTSDQMPKHTHTFTGTSVTSGNESRSHTHSVTAKGTLNTAGSHTHAPVGGSSYYYGEFKNTGTAVSQQTTEKTIQADPVLKSATGSAGSHTHTFTGVAVTSANANQTHTHTVTAKGTNAEVGGGKSHDNMPPYLAVYVWQRTA